MLGQQAAAGSYGSGKAQHIERREPAQAPPPEPVTPSSDDDWVPPKHAVPYGPFLSLAALEYLFFAGRVCAARRVNFERLYDLPERVIPGAWSGPLLRAPEPFRATRE